MMYIMNSPNHLKHLKVLEYYHKDIDTKMFTTHFSRKEKEYGKRGLDEQLERNLNISEDENQRDKISNSQ